MNQITSKSNKLLATTTELVDPAKIKQISYIVSPNGQIKSISDGPSSLSIQDGMLMANLPGIADITLGHAEDFTIQKAVDS